jgi:hypothetical protein
MGSERLQCVILGACDAIKELFPEHPDKRSLLKRALPYLSEEDADHWCEYFGLV